MAISHYRDNFGRWQKIVTVNLTKKLIKEAEAMRVNLEQVVADKLLEIHKQNVVASYYPRARGEQEKAEFNKLATTLTSEKRRKDLLSVGGSKELLDDKEFKEFSSQFNSQVSIKDIYEMYNKIKPKKEVETPGSMQNHNPSAKKDRYTEEEISSMTSADLDDPEVWAAVVRSLQK